jgi:DUF917 family protein
VIPLEIGGGNGLIGLISDASTAMNIPAIDEDWMGRAYPVSWQTAPVVHEKKAQIILTCISDGNRRVILRPVPRDGWIRLLTVGTIHDQSTYRARC